MKNFADFLAAVRDKICALAEKNTRRNSNGDTVIARAEPWFREHIRGDDYKKLCDDGARVAGDCNRVINRLQKFS